MAPAPTPWHQVVTLKSELRTGELSLSQFAADLHEVVSRAGRRPLYEDPEKFFALTYPTFALRDLARDVAARLAGRSDKAVRQLEMTYGGGKTYVDAPKWASADSEPSRWQSGQVLSYVRPLDAALYWPRARMVFVRS
ncbi:MAG: hypothetical protein OXE96_05870, partial [Gemmatimonadetes bacterium]|nr:hypothetical protein [Gemmatimonadota bacterium]